MNPLRVAGPLVVTAVLTMGANLLMRHGLVSAGGFSLATRPPWKTVLILAAQPTFVIGVVAYGIAAVVWIHVLSTAEVTVAYPILVGLTFALVSVGGYLWLGESMPAGKVIGLLVILLGIVIVGRGA